MTTPADIKALQDKKKAEGQKAPEITPEAAPKKPFKRQPHLTTRPLKDNEGLVALRDSLQKPKRRGGSRDAKRSH